MENQDPKENRQIDIINEQINEALKDIERITEKKTTIKSASDIEKLEKKIIEATDRLAGLITARKIQEGLDSEEVKQESKELVSNLGKKMKNQGQREVEITPSRGGPVKVKATYYSKSKKKRHRKKKKTVKHGFYPGLFLFGIHDRLTPGLASEISLMAVVLSSFEEARQILSERGLDIDGKKIGEIAKRYAKRAEVVKGRRGIEISETVAGLRVIVSTDGGRIRIRKNKRGPKTARGRNRYTTKWREPKLMIIYTVNDKGERDRSFLPFIEGTMKGPDAVFGLIKYYLAKLDITRADKVLFVADGARWIWNRVPELVKQLGIPLDRFYEVLDFYHAVEHLSTVAKLRKKWKASERKKWIRKNRHLLLEGKVKQVIDSVLSICRGCKSQKLRRERDYFVRNQKRMQYATVKQVGLPIGSGAMESAIRRVVNLRLKGASFYWLSDTAETMLLLRSFYKSGRWDMLKELSFSESYPIV